MKCIIKRRHFDDSYDDNQKRAVILQKPNFVSLVFGSYRLRIGGQLIEQRVSIST